MRSSTESGVEQMTETNGWNRCSALPNSACDRQARSKGGKYCVSHANKINRGEAPVPLKPWGRGRNRTCVGPGWKAQPCDRAAIHNEFEPGPLCKGHARQLQAEGTMWQLQPKGDDWNDCSALDFTCGRKAHSKGARFCRTHYNQYYRGKLAPIKRKSPNGTRCQGPGPDATECGRNDIHQDQPIPLCKSHATQYNETGSMQIIVPRRRFGSLVRDDEGRKRCTACGLWKSEEAFGKGGSADGFASRCLPCSNDASRIRKFGITRAQYDAMLDAQGGVCWLCKEAPDFGRESLNVDHDHACCSDNYKTCGKCVRGLICGACNLGLGLFGHDPQRLEAARKYLTEGVSHVQEHLRSAGTAEGPECRDRRISVLKAQNP